MTHIIKNRKLWVQLNLCSHSSYFVFVSLLCLSVSTTHSDVLCEDVRPSLLSGGFQCGVHADLDGRHRNCDRRAQSLLSSSWPEPWERHGAQTSVGNCYWDDEEPVVPKSHQRLLLGCFITWLWAPPLGHIVTLQDWFLPHTTKQQKWKQLLYNPTKQWTFSCQGHMMCQIYLLWQVIP